MYSPAKPPSDTVDTREIDKFSKHSAYWWDEKGPFKPLHQLNPLRIEFIRDYTLQLSKKSQKTLEGLKILDVGCGGGLLTEPLVRLGAEVTGVDASQEAIQVARSHAAAQDLPIQYLHASPEELNPSQQFDVVTALEIVEHVADVSAFMDTVTKLVKPDGLFFFSTLNKTVKSFVLGKMTAEYILRLVPPGTHDWTKFVKPSHLDLLLRKNGLTLKKLIGITLHPLKREWIFTSDLKVNYMGVALKE